MLFEKKYHWIIAYKKKRENRFTIIPNPSWGWCADPFLVEFKSEIYIFAEAFLYKSERKGVIVYCKYNGSDFSDWKVTMDKHWHLSYPNVFVSNGDLFMCPESYQNETVSLYKLLDFPDQWERYKILIDNKKFVDTTFLTFNDKEYLFTFEPTFHNAEGSLLLYKRENSHYMRIGTITSNKRNARPAGNFFTEEGRLYRVAQKSERTYGEGIVLMEVEDLYPTYKEHESREIYPNDIQVNSHKKFCGIHTYNRYNEFEVVDLKYKVLSFSEWIARKRIKKVFVDKYNC